MELLKSAHTISGSGPHPQHRPNAMFDCANVPIMSTLRLLECHCVIVCAQRPCPSSTTFEYIWPVARAPCPAQYISSWAGQCNVYPAFSGSFYTFTLFWPYLQFSIFLIYVKRSLAFLILLKTVYNGWFPFHHALIIVIGTENTYFQYENIY